jgi:hypothetical protein
MVKVFAALGALGLLLVFVMAYNLGESKQSTKSSALIEAQRRRIEETKGQHAACVQHSERLASGDVTAEDQIRMLTNRLEYFQQRGKDLKDEQQKLQHDVAECQRQKEEDRKIHTGTTELDAEGAYNKLLWEHQQLRLILNDVQGNKTRTREETIRLIRSYRLDNLNLISEAKKQGFGVAKRLGSIRGKKKGVAFEKVVPTTAVPPTPVPTTTTVAPITTTTTAAPETTTTTTSAPVVAAPVATVAQAAAVPVVTAAAPKATGPVDEDAPQ